MSLLRVGVVGASGFLGGEAVRLLAAHPRVELSMLCAGRSAGRDLGEVRPSLAGLPLVLEAADAEALARRCDAVVLALPHGESARLGGALYDRGVTVIDLGSDFRLRDPADHVRYYGREPGRPDLLPLACYSLPELTGPPPADCRLIASPGCFATALALGLAPLAPLLDTDARVPVFGVTGSSGSGIAPSPRVHHALRSTSFTAYRPLAHQHLGELRQLLGDRGPVPAIDFVPHSAPLTRGIHLTISIRAAELDANPLALYREAYDDDALIQVAEREIALGAVIGSCGAMIGVTSSNEVHVIFVAIDNLLKGGAGQAVQSLNLCRGWDETQGLPLIGMWP